MSQEEYASRRHQLMQKIGPEGVAIIFAAPEYLRNGDNHYPYRQDSDFYYLTGFAEPESVALLLPQRAEGSYVLFTRPRDPARELWDGPRAGQEVARQQFGADQAYAINELEELLPQLLHDRKQLYCAFGKDVITEQRMWSCIQNLRAKASPAVVVPTTFSDINTLLHELRLFKSETEITLMRKAAAVSAQAHVRAMQVCRPGLKEFQIEAEMYRIILDGGCQAMAYNPIVAAGQNACTLHYVANNAELKAGDLLLVDVGGEYQNYAADITRTFPISGHFSPEQRAIYGLVLEAQLAGIATIKPGASWSKIQEVMVQIITAGLINLGVLQGNQETLIEQKAYRNFYMHNSGHWLGLDVHDAGKYKIDGEWRPLQAGMVLTVEPGIYIAAGTAGVAEKWWNIGVRIEDDVLVTATGHEVLSSAAPKSVAEIEAVMARGPQ